MDLIFASIIILLASIVQGATSFGFSLLALPLLGLLFELKIVVPTLVVFSLVLNFIILIKLKMKPHLKDIGLLAIFAVVCIPIGVQLLIVVDETKLKLFVSILLIVISLIMISGVKQIGRASWRARV